MQVVESILKLNISEALTTVESTKLCNSFKLAILIYFFLLKQFTQLVSSGFEKINCKYPLKELKAAVCFD